MSSSYQVNYTGAQVDAAIEKALELYTNSQIDNFLLQKVDTAITINGKALTDNITLTASDVGALPSSTAIPTKVSDLTNDAGYTTNTGTITGIKMNGASKGTSGVVDLGTVITSQYVHPTTSGNKHIPSGGSSGQFLKWSADGTATWAADNDTKNTAGSTDTSSKIFLVGATSQAANPQTYSHDTAFVDANGRVNSAAPASDANDTTVATTKWVKDQSYVTTNTTQTISGTKTFTGNPVFSNDAFGAQLTVNRTNNASGYSVIKYSNGGTVKGYMGLHYDGSPIWCNTSNTAFNLVRNSTLNTAVGSATKGVYINASGVATAMTYELNKTVPSNAVFTDTNTLMTQNVSSTNATYPILACPTANATANQGAKTGIFASGIKINPSTNAITATTFNGTATVAKKVDGGTLNDTATADLVTVKMGSSDYFRIRAGGTGNNGGWVELATADDSNEPIYVRQYSGQFGTITRTATLLNASGNTELPGSLSIGNGGATMQYNSTTEAIEFVFA